MGTGLGFYNAVHAIQLGWFELDKNYLNISKSGAYSVDWLGKRVGGVKALRIQRGPGGYPFADLVVELRRNKGIYDSTLNPNAWNGGLIHHDKDEWHTDLLDFTPGSSSSDFSDAALRSRQDVG